MTPWQEYKKKLGTTRPWDIVDESKRAPDFIAQKRFATCLECSRFIHATKQCKECGCFMNIKTHLADAECPLGKWEYE